MKQRTQDLLGCLFLLACGGGVVVGLVVIGILIGMNI
jgi:hypothetical protein